MSTQTQTTIQGFQEASDFIARRLIIASDGPERAGKTNFALTMPDPIAILPMDTGVGEIAAKFRREGKRVLIPTESFTFDSKQPKQDYEKLWKKVQDAYDRCLESKGLKSMIIDTGTEFWELLRLTRFGKLTQVMPQHYGPVNEEFRSLIRKIYDREDLNLVITHKIKKKYVGNKPKPGTDAKEVWDGSYERAGMNDVGYLVQSNITHGYDRETREFYIDIKDCRQNPSVAYTTLGMGENGRGQKCDFELPVCFDSLMEIIYS